MKLKQRLLSSLILWTSLVLLMVAFKLQGVLWILWIFILGSELEITKLFRSDKKQLCFDWFLSTAFIFSYFYVSQYDVEQTDFLYALALIFICNWSVLVGKNIQCFLDTLFCFWYLPFNLHFLFKMAELYQWDARISLSVFIWITLVTKLTDVGGYFIGCSCGKHALASKISPQKTWEGGIGGIMFALMGGIVAQLLFSHSLPANFTWIHSIIFSVILALGSIISDLFESLLKRRWQVKDSGKIIPGIGGILDLIDSLLLNFPLAYILFKHFV